MKRKMQKEFFATNRKKIAKKLEPDSLMVLFSGRAPHCSADEYYRFVPSKNFYYLTGVDEEEVVLLLEKRGTKVTETLFVHKPDPVMERWVGKCMRTDEAKERSGVENINFVDGFEDYFSRLLNNYDFKKAYLDLFRMDPKDSNGPARVFADTVQSQYPQLRIRNIYLDIRNLRMVKRAPEIACLENALYVTRLGIERMLSHARPGMMEHEIEAHFDFVLTSMGKYKNSFPSIVASGKNATTLHYCSNNSKAESGSLVLLDLGAASDYYCGDCSRTFPIDGKFTERQRVLYCTVLKAQEAVIDMIKPGVHFPDLNKKAEQVLIKESKKIGLIKEDKEIEEYYFHGVSHFLGMDTHDMWDRDTRLEKGMVFTVEPGIYIEEEGIGIRIEDNILVTENGYRNLSQDIIKDPDEIEIFMKK